MRSISVLCCYIFPPFEHRHSNVKGTGDATGEQTLTRIDHSEGLRHIDTEPSHSSIHTEPVGVARGSGSDLGMGSGRDRLGDGNRNLALPRKYITRQKRKHRHAGNPGRHGPEEADLSIISDPNALYLGPLISVSSNGTEIRAIPAPERPVEDTMQRSGSASTAVPSPTKEKPQERPTDAEGKVSLGPQVRQASPKDKFVGRTTPSKPASLLVDDDSWSPFQTWLLTQTLDADTSPSRGADVKATPNPGTIVTNDVRDKIRPRKGNPPDLEPVQISTDNTPRKHQTSKERHTSKGLAVRSKSHSNATDRMAHSSGARYSRHNKGSSHSPGQRTNSDTNSPGRRNIHGSLPSWDEDKRVYGVYRESDRSSYKTATDMMSAPSRGMSDSSYYETQEGSGYESTFPGQSIPGSLPRFSTSGSREGPGTLSALPNPLGALTGRRDGRKKLVRSKFREEFGEVAPDQAPRFRIVSKLRGLSHQGQPPVSPKRSGEVVTNHIFLSDYDTEDVQTRRNLLYHGCPQAAESAPEGWQQSLRRRKPSTADSYPGEAQSVKELKTFANEPWVAYPTGGSGYGATSESTSELIPSPLRTPLGIPRAGDESLGISGPSPHGKALGVPERSSEGARRAAPWAGWRPRTRGSESSGHGCPRMNGIGDVAGQSESRDSKDGLRSPRWPFSKNSGNARKMGSNCLPLKAASPDASETQPQVRGRAQFTQAL